MINYVPVLTRGRIYRETPEGLVDAVCDPQDLTFIFPPDQLPLFNCSLREEDRKGADYAVKDKNGWRWAFDYELRFSR